MTLRENDLYLAKENRIEDNTSGRSCRLSSSSTDNCIKAIVDVSKTNTFVWLFNF